MSFEQDLSTALEAIERLKNQKNELNKLVGTLDRKVNDLYHVIELLPLSASELAKVTKTLREVLQQRREAKENIIAVSNFLTTTVEKVKPKEVQDKNAELREDKYRQESLAVFESIFGRKKVLT